MRAKRSELGLKGGDGMAIGGGVELGFFDAAGSGSVQLRSDGSLLLGAETECLPDPER